ncbi:putative bifunctional diguanylate cyclase/phosphodiesterase [Paenibacillus tarimensis]
MRTTEMHNVRYRFLFPLGALLCLLITAGVCFLHIPLIFGLSLSFSMMFLFIALRLFGQLTTAVISIAAAFISVFVFDHSLIAFAMAAEVLFVGYILKRRPGSQLIIADLLYWLTLGLLVYAFLYDWPPDHGAAAFISMYFKAVLSGAFNSLLADMATTYLPLHKWLTAKEKRKTQYFSLHNILFHMVLLAVTVPFILFMVTSSKYQNEAIVERTAQIADNLVSYINHDLGTWSERELQLLKLNGLVQLGRLNQLAAEAASHSDATLYIVDNEGTIVADSADASRWQQWDATNQGRLIAVQDSLYIWLPAVRNLLFETEEWRNAKFYYKAVLNGLPLTLLIEVPLSVYMDEILPLYALHYGFVLLCIVIAIIGTVVFSRAISQALHKVSIASAELPSKTQRFEEVEWPSSNIVEVHRLIGNFQHMSGILLYIFLETIRVNEKLKKQTEQLKESEQRLHELAYYDELTGLPNRLYFNERLGALIHSAETGEIPFAILFLDLDRFKHINDTMGHAAGDQLLISVAERLKRQVGTVDICRLGGDEFVVIIPYQNHDEIVHAASRILEGLNSPITVLDVEVMVKTSIGISLYSRDAATIDAMLKNADLAMYEAKARGGSRFLFYSETMKDKISERLRLELSLHRAFASNELEIYYQPKYDSRTYRIVGVEALLRWHHPEMGMIPPDHFIPIMEETGDIIQIGEWILRQACRDLRELRRMGYTDLTVAVNLSPRQLDMPGLVSLVGAILGEASLDPEHLELEVTEEFLVRDRESAVDVLTGFKSMGISIAIDDFGTGYSSFSQLKLLRPNTIKIDKSFIRHIHEDEHNASIVKALTDMSKSLQIKVVAEGVETAEELQIVQSFQCECIQGYYFSQPLTRTNLIALLAREHQEQR